MFLDMKRFVVGTVGALLILFSVLVWPTRWSSGVVHLGDSTYTARTDRITGDVQVLTRSGWKAIGNPQPNTARASQPQTPASQCPVASPNLFADIACR